MTKVIYVAEISVAADLDGSLDDLIERLIAYRDDAARARLTNVRTETDYEDDNGRSWKLFIIGNAPPIYEPKLPPEQYERFFKMGVDAAESGESSDSPFGSDASNDICVEAWQAGYNSVNV